MKFRKHIITVLFCISLLLSILPMNPVDLKIFLPIDVYKKVIWGERISMVSYEILVLIIIADVWLREKAEYFEKKNIQLIILILFFICLTVLTFPKL